MRLKQAPDGRTNAVKKFQKYKGEGANPIREVAVKENPGVIQMIGNWKKVDRVFDRLQIERIMEVFLYQKKAEEYFERMLPVANKGGGFSAREIAAFCLHKEFVDSCSSGMLQVWDTVKPAVFISALIDASPDNEFIINVAHLPIHICNFGVRNRKQVEVIGDLGMNTGIIMEGGKLVVHGNTNLHLGERMRGGNIIVKGTAESPIGGGSKGGRIDMEGGIHVNTPLPLFGKPSCKAMVYHKGRRLDRRRKTIHYIDHE